MLNLKIFSLPGNFFDQVILTFNCFNIDILTLVTETTDITQNLIRERTLQNVLQSLHKHDLHLQLVLPADHATEIFLK